MKIISSFKPAVSYGELKTIFLRMLFDGRVHDRISAFEDEFARYVGVKHAIRAPSGRWALYSILKNLKLEEGDEVILPAFTYFAVPAAIVKLGLKPVFVDIDLGSLNIDVQKIRDSITRKTKVIIPTHLCGFTCDLEGIADIAGKYDIRIIEDCAQSLGAEYKDKKTGAWGDVAYFTFGITKNFTTLGGAMITTNNDELADDMRQKIKIKDMRNMVLFSKWLQAYAMKVASSSAVFPCVYYIMRIFSIFGIDIIKSIFNEKDALLGNLPESGLLNDIQAELGIMQLNSLDRKNDSRMKRGLEFYEFLKDVKGVQVPLLVSSGKNIFSGCPVLFKDKKNAKRILLENGIDVSAGYMQNCANLRIFRKYKKECPNASRTENEILYFPMYPELEEPESLYVSGIIKKIAGN